MVYSIPSPDEIHDGNVVESLKRLTFAFQSMSESAAMWDISLADKITDLRTDMNAGFEKLDHRLLNVEQDIGGLKREMSEVKQDIREMKGDINEMKGDIKGLKKEMKQTREETVDLLKQIVENTRK